MMPYSIHAALLLAICLLFYKLLLQRETYYRLNRVVLLACMALSFALPLIPVPQQLSLRKTAAMANYIPATSTINESKPVNNESLVKETAAKSDIKTITPGVPLMQQVIQWVYWLYWCGVVIFGINFLLQIIVLFYQAYKKPAIQDGIYRIVELDSDKAPCSFGNTIFINPAKYDWETYNQILMHEKVHIKQGHSFDLVIAELMLVLQWFNPFAWLYRKELENNLEFLTDDSVLHHYKIEPAGYQLSLLKVSVPNYSMRISTNYNQSLLKKRIVMMNATRSNIHIVWKYLMLVPLLAVLVCGLNEPMAESRPLVALNPANSRLSDTVKRNSRLKKQSTINLISRKKTAAKMLQNAGAKKTATQQVAAAKNSQVDSGHITNTHPANHVDIDANDIISFQSAGISSSYVRGLREAGFKDLSFTTIKSLSGYGITVEYVKGLIEAGVKDLSVKTIESLAGYGITAEYAKGLHDAHINDMSAYTIESLAGYGITTEYAKGLHEAGINDMSVYTIESLAGYGITVKYVKGLHDAGIKDMSVNTIESLAGRGITPENARIFLGTGLGASH